MHSIIKVYFIVIFLSFTVNGQIEKTDWENSSSLPLLRVHKLSVPSKESFKEGIDGSVHFIDSTFKDEVSHLQNDSVAVNMAYNFINTNLSIDGELIVNKIIHSSNGEEEIKAESDSGYTIIYDVYYKKIKLNHYYGHLYLSGQKINEANFKLPGKIEPVSESTKNVLTKENAIRIFEEQVEKAFKKKYTADNIELVYTWYPLDNIQNGMDFSKPILRPNWLITFGGGRELLIDAFDGKLWRDD